jgi:phosphomevalonate kinase
LVRYRRYPVEQLLEPAATGQLFRALAKGPPVDVFRLPLSRIRLSYAFAGASASTPQLISEVEHRLSQDARARFVQSSDELGQAHEEAMIRGDFATIRRSTAELHQLLASLGPLETDSMRRILSIARSHGAAGKLSGAGGGDGCILFAPDVESQSSMLSALKAKGFWSTALELESGLVAEPQPDPVLQKWLGS